MLLTLSSLLRPPFLRAGFLSAAFAVGCAAPQSRGAPTGIEPEGEIVVTINPEHVFQTIRNFGASDAWSVQFVGRNWPVEKRQEIADLLFSMELGPDGSPAGIGLSAWRFNVGAGSAAQGRESGIRDRWRRTHSFMNADGSFDPHAQAGQRSFLRLARDRGVEQFYAFVNSPPVPLTRNGRAHSSGGASANLAPERYDDFARFLRDVVREVELRDGVAFDYVSPFNEPQWDWTGGQEGSPWTNAEVTEAVRVLSSTLMEAGLQTEIEVVETARLNYLYEVGDKPERGEQIRAFFSPSSPQYLGTLPNVAHSIAAHSYFTTYPTDTLRAVRRRVRDEILAVDPELELIVSEYTILEDNPVIEGRGRDLGMDAALYMAGVIHSDLVDAHASAWQWWLAVSPYDYKDGLVYIDQDTLNGAVHESKMLWTLGNWSRFVRPGMQRVGVEILNPTDLPAEGEPPLVSAFRDPADGRLVMVVVNRAQVERTVRFEGASNTAFRLYRTDAEADLEDTGVLSADERITVPPRSVITLVSQVRGP